VAEIGEIWIAASLFRCYLSPFILSLSPTIIPIISFKRLLLGAALSLA